MHVKISEVNNECPYKWLMAGIFKQFKISKYNSKYICALIRSKYTLLKYESSDEMQMTINVLVEVALIVAF